MCSQALEAGRLATTPVIALMRISRMGKLRRYAQTDLPMVYAWVATRFLNPSSTLLLRVSSHFHRLESILVLADKVKSQDVKACR